MTQPNPTSGQTTSTGTALDRKSISNAVSNAASLELDKAQLENSKKAQEIRQNADYHKWRRRFSIVVLLFSFIWLIVEVSTIISAGTGFLYGIPFKLSDNVLIAILTTAAATILGLFAIFLRWLYPSTDKEKAEEGKDKEK